MEDLKKIIANNLIELRSNAGLKQIELAERIHYSDKSVSKWERAEALPDVVVLKQIADIFGVTLDYMVHPHDEWLEEHGRGLDRNVWPSGGGEPPAVVAFASTPSGDAGEEGAAKPARSVDYHMIIRVVEAGIWTVALLVFIILWLAWKPCFTVFLGACPIALITLLILHSVFERGRHNCWILSGLMVSILVLLYYILFQCGHNWWQILLLAFPMEVLIISCFRVIRPQN